MSGFSTSVVPDQTPLSSLVSSSRVPAIEATTVCADDALMRKVTRPSAETSGDFTGAGPRPRPGGPPLSAPAAAPAGGPATGPFGMALGPPGAGLAGAGFCAPLATANTVANNRRQHAARMLFIVCSFASRIAEAYPSNAAMKCGPSGASAKKPADEFRQLNGTAEAVP